MQLRKIFKFLLACCVLETYPMQTFGMFKKKKKLKCPKISVKLENLKSINTVVMIAGSCCALTLGLKLSNLCEVRDSAGALTPALEAMMFLQLQCCA